MTERKTQKGWTFEVNDYLLETGQGHVLTEGQEADAVKRVTPDYDEPAEVTARSKVLKERPVAKVLDAPETVQPKKTSGAQTKSRGSGAK